MHKYVYWLLVFCKTTFIFILVTSFLVCIDPTQTAVFIIIIDMGYIYGESTKQ